MKKGIIGGTVALSASVLISKIIGVFYRIPLINMIGAEGIGLYQQVFSVFAFLLIIVTGGVPIAVSRMVSERIAEEGEEEGYYVFRRVMQKMCIFGLLGTAVMWLLSFPIATLQGNAEAEIGYLAIAPSLFLVAIISAYRGYYQGKLNMLPTAISQLIEQIVKLAAGLLLAFAFAPKGIIYAVGGALLAVTLSEIAALIYLAFVGRKNKKYPTYNKFLGKKYDKSFYALVIPMTLANVLIPLTQLFDSFLVVGFLSLRGEAASATAQYGLLTGAVSTVVNFPVALCLTIAVTIVPVLSSFAGKRNIDLIREKARIGMKTSYVIGVFAALMLFVTSNGVIRLLFPSLSGADFEISSILLKISALGVIFISELQITSNVLQATGDTSDPIFTLLIVAILKVGLTILLTYFLGIYGTAIATFLSYFAGIIISEHILNEHLGKDTSRDRGGALAMLSGVIMFFVIFGVSKFMKNDLQILLVCGILGSIIYLVLIMVFKVFTREELQSIPLIGKLIKNRKE